MGNKVGSQTSIHFVIPDGRYSREQSGPYKKKAEIAHKATTKTYLTKYGWITMKEICKRTGLKDSRVRYLFKHKTMDEILNEYKIK